MLLFNDIPIMDSISFQNASTFYMMGLVTWHAYINCVLFGIAFFVLYFFYKNVFYWANNI
jgi:hypothetical protein